MSRDSLLGFLFLALLTASASPALPDSQAFNEASDGGAAAQATLKLPDCELTPAELAAQFPVSQRAHIHVLGGGVRGFGMLAEYGAEGLREVVVARETKVVEGEAYTPFALARVFDPDGNLAAIEDFTDQSGGRLVKRLKIDARKAGVWRVSFSGGRSGDRVEIRLPKTETWGVRGEMSLGVSDTLPKPGYLWIPPTAVRLLVGIETGPVNGFEIKDAAGKSSLGKPEEDPLKRTGRILLEKPPTDAVVRLHLPAGFNGAFVIEGAPGLLCPTEKAARRLRGGVVDSHGFLTQGPLQGRARDWMVKAAAQIERNPVFVFPSEIPADLENPRLDVLMFGKYGFANNLDSLIKLQNAHLDPADPFFGSFRDASRSVTGPNWTNFQMPVSSTMFESAALANAVAFPSKLNPAKDNVDLARRVALGTFTTFMALQGDDLVRESSLEKTRYPMTHSFFIYPPAMAQAYHTVRDHLDPEAKAIWREALIAVGDKLCDYQGYQSNQWSHMILGHLETYLGTGEKRFLRYFERLATAYFDNTFGDSGKFGQHSAGYFLEEYGPDGNYDHLSAFHVVAAWYYYRELPEADPALVEKMRAGIEKNIRFSSFFWLPDPAGAIVSPTSFNCRTTSPISGLGYPGMIMAKADFPLGLTRFNMTARPERGLGGAATFSYIANTDEWIRAVFQEGLRRGSSGFPGREGAWVSHVHKTYSQPQRVEPGTPPVHDIGATWELPGMFAWNRGGLYGAVFADVHGATHELNGFVGGGPVALWTSATGAFLLGVAPDAPQSGAVVRIKTKQLQHDASGLTFACVYGHRADGEFFHSGKERSTVKTIDARKVYEVLGRLEAPRAELKWRYDLASEKAVGFSVSMKAETAITDAFLNLPMRAVGATRLRLESPHALVVEVVDAEGSVARVAARMTWPPGVAGRLEPSLLKELSRLVIPLPVDGSPLPISIVIEEPVARSAVKTSAGGGIGITAVR